MTRRNFHFRHEILAQKMDFYLLYFIFPKASRLIVTFDEHVISNNFKFGVIYQKFGQVSPTGVSLSFSASLAPFL